ncbi:MAG: hypothetical protein V1792_03630 [Pseudomonadota bacterium]
MSKRFRSLSVGVFAVVHRGDIHKEVLVINFVKNAITALANSIAATVKLLDSRRSGIVSKLVDPVPYRVAIFHGN